MRRIFSAASAALVVIAASAGWPTSAATPSTRAPAVQAVVDCRAIADPTQRLACYDDAVAKLTAAEASGDLLTLDKEQRRAARRQVFGLPLPSLGFLDRGEQAGESDKITEKIASASQDPYGKWTVVLEDGAIWVQIDDGQLDRPPHSGSSAEIRRAALGSFFMKIDGQLSIRVRRER